MAKVNLSEKLFKPSFKYPETSSLIRRSSNGDELNPCSNWYRTINKPLWIWRGINAVELESVLARIASSKNQRTDESKLDTVVGYRNGNWIYEWSKQAMEWQQKAQDCAPEDKNNSGQYWLTAAALYSLASYPHIRGDDLAAQAESLANRAFQESAKNLSYHLKLIEFKVDGGKLTGSFYLPDVENGPYPTILLCGSLDDLQNDYHRLFQDYFAPAGIAVLCIDLPSIGYSNRWKLTQDTSLLHQQVLQQMRNVPWIDHQKIIALGIQFGANVAVRLAYLEPKLLKGVIAWGGIVHQMYVDNNTQRDVPTMYRDMLASRLGLHLTSDSLLQAEISSYSLKLQGLLGRRCQTPMLAVNRASEPFSPLSDAKLIASSSLKGKLIQTPARPMIDNFQYAIEQIVEWANERFAD